MGGGFGVGIHNILEAAVYGMPVVFGPNYHKFREAVEMVKVGGAFPVNDGNDFSRVMDDLMEVDSDSFQRASAEARQFVSNNCGATDAVLKAVFKESSK